MAAYVNDPVFQTSIPLAAIGKIAGNVPYSLLPVRDGRGTFWTCFKLNEGKVYYGTCI